MKTTSYAWIAASVGGALLGVASVLSPALLCFVAVAALLTAWSGSGLAGRERRVIISVIAGSLFVRALVVAVLFLTTDHTLRPYGVLIGDERQILERSEWLKNIAVGIPLAPTDWDYAFQEYGNSGLPYVYAAMHMMIGDSPYGAHLLNTLMAVTGAVILHKLLRSSYGRVPALATLLLLLCVPTLFVWSVSALKEPAFFLLTTVALASIMVAVSSPHLLLRPLAAVVAIAAINGVALIRPVGWAVCLGGFAVGIAARVATRRAWLCVAGLVVAIVVVGRAVQQPQVQAQILQQFRTVAVVHIGNVETQGYAYKLLDSYFYTRWMANNTVAFMQLDEAARYALRAFVSFFAVPTPWQIVSLPALLFLPEQVLWYCAILLAIVGVSAGLRRDSWLTMLLAGYCLVGAAIISLPSGNIGTFIRMRDMVVPFVFCLSGLGASSVVEQVARRLMRTSSGGVNEERFRGEHAVAR